jgi:hypothetical protein
MWARRGAAAPRCDWLNRAVAIGAGRRLLAGGNYEIFEVAETGPETG